MLAATIRHSAKHWHDLGKQVEFQHEAAPILKYLGAFYRLDDYNAKIPNAPRTLAVSMTDYIKKLIGRFKDEYGKPLPKVTSPYVTEKEWVQTRSAIIPKTKEAEEVSQQIMDYEEAGRFQQNCASYVATALFATRVCRADITTAVQRLCTQISKWSIGADGALTRLIAYLDAEPDLEMAGTLSPDDVSDLELLVWPDADWNGDANTSKSTGGLFIELHSPSSGHSFPIIWKSALQTTTASSSAESETVNLSTTLRQEALPVQEMFEALLGKRLMIRCKVDNTQAIAAVKKGYSKRLRHLNRMHRVSLGVINELLEDKQAAVEVGFVPTAEQKGDIFTKALLPSAFVRATDVIGIRRPDTSV